MARKSLSMAARERNAAYTRIKQWQKRAARLLATPGWLESLRQTSPRSVTARASGDDTTSNDPQEETCDSISADPDHITE